MSRMDWWLSSGLASQAAENLVWFVAMALAIVGIVIWRDK